MTNKTNGGASTRQDTCIWIPFLVMRRYLPQIRVSGDARSTVSLNTAKCTTLENVVLI
jgi:hypothetical protein